MPFQLSINQSNPVLLFILERVRTPRVGRTAALREALPHCGVGSSLLFFTDDLQPALSWASQGLSLKAARSSFTHSDQVFLGLPRPLLPSMDIDLTLLISPEERSTCPNHLNLRLLMRVARSSRPSFLCSTSMSGSSEGLTPQIHLIIARSFRHNLWRASEDMGQVSVACSIELRTFELSKRPLTLSGSARAVSSGTCL